MKDTIFIAAADMPCVKVDAPVIGVKLNELGYWPIYTHATPAELNGAELDEQVKDSAIMASMFGWRTKGAEKARAYLAESDDSEPYFTGRDTEQD